MSCRIREVEVLIECAAGHADSHPAFQGRILLNYITIENAHKVRKKLSIFRYV